MSTLVGKNIVKRYGKDTVLKNVDINIETGKIYGLIGRNGAGKTTLLSILTAQNPASEGTVTLIIAWLTTRRVAVNNDL